MVEDVISLNKIIIENFIKSKKIYNEFIKINRRKPYQDEWNKIAKRYNLLSNVSMRYIGNIAFKRKRVSKGT